MEISILPQPRAIHPDMSNQVTAGIDHRDVVGNPKLLGLLFARGDQAARLGKTERADLTRHANFSSE